MKNKRIEATLVIIFVSIALLVITTPIHEGLHWIMSDIDPNIKPISYHVFDAESLNSGCLGFVRVAEKRQGAFDNGYEYTYLLQEIICISTQLLIIFLVDVMIFKKRYQYLIQAEYPPSKLYTSPYT